MWAGDFLPRFYSTYSLLSNHSALSSFSPQACISDFDDFHHNGAYLLSYLKATPLFGIQKSEQTTKSWYQFPDLGTKMTTSFIWMQVLCQT
jgi:hypothetical protein